MARDLDALRQRLQDHRDVLSELEADAPSQALAQRYAALRVWIEQTIETLHTSPPETDMPPAAAAAASTDRTAADPVVPASAPPEGGSEPWQHEEAEQPGHDRVRMMSILILGIAAIALLGFLFVRFFSDPDGAGAIRDIPSSSAAEDLSAGDAAIDEEPTPVVIEEETAPPPLPDAEPEAAASAAEPSRLEIDPAVATVEGLGRGRVIRQFRVENPGSAPVRITVERSECRCLWYDFTPEIPAGSGAVLEVTVDGSRLTGDQLDETIGILRASDKSRLAEFRLTGSR